MDAYINANIMLRPCILLIYDARNFKGEYLGRTFVCFQFTRSIDKPGRLRYNAKARGGAGIGRQARLRCVCFARTSSSLVHRTSGKEHP